MTAGAAGLFAAVCDFWGLCTEPWVGFFLVTTPAVRRTTCGARHRIRVQPKITGASTSSSVTFHVRASMVVVCA